MNDLINSRKYSIIQSVETEFTYLPDKNYLFDLGYLTSITVEGDKACDFLQGQLSCNLSDVTTQQMRQGLMCNLKGRILAALDVVYWMEHGFSLILPVDLCLDTQASLAKAALFSRVKLRQNSFKLLGLYIQHQADLKPFGIQLPIDLYGVVSQKNVCCYKIDTSFYILMVQADEVIPLCEPFIAHGQYRGSLAWHAHQIQNFRAEIYPESRGLFLPHRLNMHKTGYINFDKGCYKGQEIIARMHYRAAQKHTLVCLNIQSINTPRIGQALHSEDGLSVIGELVDYCYRGGDCYNILASVLIDYQDVKGLSINKHHNSGPAHEKNLD